MTDVVAIPTDKPRVHIAVGFGRVQYSGELVYLSLRICEHLSWVKRVDTPNFQLQIPRAYDVYPNSSFVGIVRSLDACVDTSNFQLQIPRAYDVYTNRYFVGIVR